MTGTATDNHRQEIEGDRLMPFDGASAHDILAAVEIAQTVAACMSPPARLEYIGFILEHLAAFCPADADYSGHLLRMVYELLSAMNDAETVH